MRCSGRRTTPENSGADSQEPEGTCAIPDRRLHLHAVLPVIGAPGRHPSANGTLADR
jgi:hypothetical protein